FLKRHTGFGPGGPGAIYRIDRATGIATTFWTVNAGVDPHPQPPNEFNCMGAPSNYCWFYDPNTVGQIGKMSLGGLTFSHDQKNLFVMNLLDRRLYQIDVATATTVTSYPFPLNQGDCTGDPDDIRPFAVRVHQGLVYVGAVCTAESLATLPDDNPNRRVMRL